VGHADLEVLGEVVEGAVEQVAEEDQILKDFFIGLF
jgi:hypothetical protein